MTVEGSPEARTISPGEVLASATRAPKDLTVSGNDIFLQFTHDARRDEPAHRSAAGTTARPARRLQVLRRQGRAAVCRQGAVAAQSRALVLPQIGHARPMHAPDGH